MVPGPVRSHSNTGLVTKAVRSDFDVQVPMLAFVLCLGKNSSICHDSTCVLYTDLIVIEPAEIIRTFCCILLCLTPSVHCVLQKTYEAVEIILLLFTKQKQARACACARKVIFHSMVKYY